MDSKIEVLMSLHANEKEETNAKKIQEILYDIINISTYGMKRGTPYEPKKPIKHYIKPDTKSGEFPEKMRKRIKEKLENVTFVVEVPREKRKVTIEKYQIKYYKEKTKENN